jgi:hypothetical protein
MTATGAEALEREVMGRRFRRMTQVPGSEAPRQASLPS